MVKDIDLKPKKKMNKEFHRVLDEIEDYRIRMYEADKRSSRNRKDRKRINKEEAEFFINMDSIKCRKKISKKWQKTGFIDRIIELLNEASPFIKLLARAIASLITLFLSTPMIKEHISPKVISALSKVFDIAMAM